MAIKEYIYLLGVEDVEASLKRLSDQGEQSLAQFRELGAAGGAEQFAPIAEGSKEAAAATEELTFKAHDLRGALYILRPILQAAGIEVGQFGTLGRLAGVGLGGLAAAAAGAVVVGLARLEDAARTTKGQLDDLFQSKALSEKAFAGIQASALQFNTTVANIVPGVEALKTAWERFITETRTFKFVAPTGGDIGQIIPPGMIGSVESLQTAYDNFLKLLRAGRLDQTAATEAAKVFFTAMQNGGKVTADMLRTLPVGTINQLAQAMGRGTISTQQFINEVKLAPIGMDRLLEALNRFTLQSDEAFRANAIITYKDKLGEILNTLADGFKGLTGISFSDFIVKQLDGIKKGIQDARAELEWVKGWITWIEQHTEMPGMGKLVQDLKNIAGETPTEDINRAWEASGISARERFIRGFRNAPGAGVDIAETVKSDATSAAEAFGKGWVFAPKAIEKAASEGAQTATSVWDSFFEGLKNKWEEWKKSLSGFELGISPAGAAELSAPLDKAAKATDELSKNQKQLLIDMGMTEDEVNKLGNANKQAGQLATTSWDGVSNSIKALADNAVSAGNQMLQQWQITQQKINANPLFAPSPPVKWTGGATPALPPGVTAIGGQETAQTQTQTQQLVVPFQEADNQIRTIWLDLAQWISESLSEIDLTTLTASLVAPFTAAVPLIRDELLKVEQMIETIVREAAAAAGAIERLRQGGTPGGGGGGFAFQEVATGGYIRGPGTGTSDSILAWLSNREYVTRAKAVEFYGVPFMDAINAMRLPKDLFGRFAVGGLARALTGAMPRFQSGGLATAAATRSLTLVLDTKRFGVTGSKAVIDDLEREAVMRGISATGIAPGWVR